VSNEEPVKQEWDNSSRAWAEFVRTGKDYTRDGLNNPATFDLIGNVEGLVVLDLACGEGYNTRMLARRGAIVTGIDFSESMIDYARVEEENEKLGIQYYNLDAACLRGLADSNFDLVTCFMSLQDIENYRKAISEVSRVLMPGGRFVFSIPHPCFEKIRLDGKKIDAARRYFERVKYVIQWNMERLSMPFRTITFHRTLTDYFEALHCSHLYVSRLIEPKLTEKAHQKYPYLQEALQKPQSVIIESVKSAAKPIKAQ
jgi:ubiquinone/menaquinone biosynthesis C-methylase UbiE